MTREEANKVVSLIDAVCVKYGLWYTIEQDKRPDTRMIRIKEISIKIDQPK